MNTGRIILLGVALLAGGGAFFLVASGGNTEAITQVIPEQDRVSTVRVLVSDKAVARGERLDPTATKWIKWPKKGLPEFLITDENQEFYDTLNTALAKTEIVIGEPITENKLIRPGSRGLMAALLAPGMRAVTMDVSARQAAAGFVLPGDRVDIYSTYEDPGKDSLVSKVMYPDIRVLAVDQIIDQSAEGAIVSRTVTLELAPRQLGKFLSAREDGTLNLILRSVFQPEGQEELLQETEPAEIIVIRYGQS